jgi:hypothetical protein
MTNSSDEQQDGHGIDDEQLPEDLRPGDDNPLAQGLDDAETAGDLDPGELLQEGKRAEQGDDSDSDGRSGEDVAARSGGDGSGDGSGDG